VRRPSRVAALVFFGGPGVLAAATARAEEPPVTVAVAPVGDPVAFADGIDGRSLVASKTGRLAYVAKRGEKVVVVLEGKPLPREWTKVEALVPSADGTRFAWWAQDGAAWFVVTESATYEAKGAPASLRDGGLVLSADGAHVAFAVRRGDSVVVVHDGKEGPASPASSAFDIAMSASGARVAYPAVSGEGGRQRRVVLDHRPLEAEHDAVGSLVFSPDGKRFAYVGEDGGRRSVVVDGKVGPAHDDVRDLAFTGDGRVVHVVRGEEGEAVVVEGEEGPRYPTVLSLVPAPVGSKVAYAARKVFRGANDQVCVVVVDGKPGADVGPVPRVVWSDDGTTVAYVTRKKVGMSVVVVGTAAGLEIDAVMAGTLVLSRDGRRVAYVVRDGRRYRSVVDHVSWEAADLVQGLAFSPDGFAYALEQTKSGPRLVVEGVATAVEGGVLGAPVPAGPGVFDLLVVRDAGGPKVQRLRATVTKR
jgi:hypothetical protein